MLELDHVTLAARSLDRLVRPFERVGLAPDYGGAHANGLTHMAMLGFAEGSYVELIAPLGELPDAVIWREFMAEDAGPAAWCVRCASPLAEAVGRLRARGVTARDPVVRGRRRPDGVYIEWELAFVGDGAPGSLHPLLIHDRTARELRIRESAGAETAGLCGIEALVIHVPDAAAAARTLGAAYDLRAAREAKLPELDAELLHFPGERLLLADARTLPPALAERCARLGPAPFAVLLGARDPDATAALLGLDGDAATRTQLRWIDGVTGPVPPWGGVGIVAAGSIAGCAAGRAVATRVDKRAAPGS